MSGVAWPRTGFPQCLAGQAGWNLSPEHAAASAKNARAPCLTRDHHDQHGLRRIDAYLSGHLHSPLAFDG
jgi:hypothetical protein